MFIKCMDRFGIFSSYIFFKNFAITESVKVQFRWETFNTMNHPNFGNPNSTFVAGSTNFGNITGTSTNNRQQQFGLKLLF